MGTSATQNQRSRAEKRFVDLRPETVTRLDGLHEVDQSYDELINELVTIYESLELSIAHGGDAIDYQG